MTCPAREIILQPSVLPPHYSPRVRGILRKLRTARGPCCISPLLLGCYSLTWVFTLLLGCFYLLCMFYSNLSPGVLLLVLSCVVCNCCWLAVCIVVALLCVLLSYVYLLYYVCIAVFTLDAGLLARSQYSEGPATGHLDTGFSWFPCVYKQMLRWFPTFQVATTCFSCSPPDLNLVVTNFMLCIHVK